ncbi:structural maintenance of chromosomes protein 4 [Ciona intestinalis]
MHVSVMQKICNVSIELLLFFLPLKTMDTDQNSANTPNNNDEPVSAETAEPVQENMEVEDSAPPEVNKEEELDLPEGITVGPPPHVFGQFGSGDPRLIITHIVNYNFKSYAGKRVLGPFHKSFTAIIGPNGSGKSNVIDSMLFVFGYRANKIRSKKLSVLIHDSENHKEATSCTVEVHFEKIVDVDESGYCSVPNSGFSVSRTARKDNTSQYFINDRRVMFKEVATLLQDSGIDLNHNRFLILQGEVEQIAMMTPKALTTHGDGMLEYLEDIIGSSRYKEAIEQLHKEIEVLDEERKDKLSRVKVVEKDKDQLEPIRNEALDFLRKKNERTGLENMQIQCYMNNLSRENEHSKAKIDEILAKVAEFEEGFSSVKEEKKEKAKECAKAAKAKERVAATLVEKRDEMRALEKRNVKVFEDRKHRKGKIKELTKKLEKEKKKISDLETLPERHENEILELTEEREELEKRKREIEESLKEAMHALKEETQQLQDQKEEQEKLLLGEVKYVNEAKQQLDLASTELGLFATKLTNAENAVARCQTRMQEASDAEKTAKRKLAELQAKGSKDLEKEVKSLEQEVETLIPEERKLESKVQESLSILMEARHSAQANRSRGKVINFLMQLKNTGKIPGIYGRLGDLGAIDPRYDVAISSCCPALENVLVDSIETARDCVEQLKRNDIGQATFIALDKMQKHEHALNNVPNTALPRLVDLIQVKEKKYHVAFYHALRDTLVAEELNVASKVAYDKKRRWRVVTLQGELIDTSGTMSGGGNRVSRGRMGSNISNESTPAEIDAMEKKKNNFEQKYEQVRERRAHCEQELAEKRKVLRNTLTQTKLLQHDLKNHHNVVAEMKQLLPQLERELNAAQPDPVQHKALQNKVKQLTKAFDAASTKTESIEKKKSELNSEISRIQDTKLSPLREKLKSTKTTLEEISKKITKLKVAVTTAKRNFVKCEKSIENTESELQENVEMVGKLEEEWKTLEVDGAAVLQALGEAEEESSKLRDALQEQQEQLKKMEKKEASVAEAYKEMKQNQEALCAGTNTRNEKIEQQKGLLGKLKLHKIDGEETPPLPSYPPEELDGVVLDELRNKITLLDIETEKLHPNMNAIEEFKAKQQVYLQRVGELDQVTGKRDKYRGMYDNLRKRRLNEFCDGFVVITNKLKEIYQMITLGGDAELEFVDSLDPFSEGINFSVRPPKKSWKTIRHLSGGEKTLSSLALVFALHYYRPTPLYVMDEIDAALDFKNVTIIAHYIKQRTRNAQFIIISLRNNMFEIADRLVGIYKTDNCTKSATIEPGLIAATASSPA